MCRSHVTNIKKALYALKFTSRDKHNEGFECVEVTSNITKVNKCVRNHVPKIAKDFECIEVTSQILRKF